MVVYDISDSDDDLVSTAPPPRRRPSAGSSRAPPIVIDDNSSSQSRAPLKAGPTVIIDSDDEDDKEEDDVDLPSVEGLIVSLTRGAGVRPSTIGLGRSISSASLFGAPSGHTASSSYQSSTSSLSWTASAPAPLPSTSRLLSSSHALPPPPPPQSRSLGRSGSSILSALDQLDHIIPVPADESPPPAPVQQPQPSGKGKRKASEVFEEEEATAGPSKKEQAKAERLRIAEEKKKAKAAEKAAKDAAKNADKERKKREKEQQARIKEVNKLVTSKNEAMRDLIVDVPPLLRSKPSPFAAAVDDLRERFEADKCTLNELPNAPALPNVVGWRRKVLARWDDTQRMWIPLDAQVIEEEPTYLVFLTARDVCDRISNGTLLSLIDSTRATLRIKTRAQVFLMLHGLEAHYRKVKNANNRAHMEGVRHSLDGGGGPVPVNAVAAAGEMGRDEIEAQLARLMTLERGFMVHVEKTEEIADWIWNLTGDIAIRPHKNIKNSHLAFSAEQKVNGVGKDLPDTFSKMLQAIPRITPAAAQGICGQYGTLRALLEAYEQCESQGEAEDMLADVVIANRVDGVPNQRPVGKASSKRIFTVLRGTDSLALI